VLGNEIDFKFSHGIATAMLVCGATGARDRGSVSAAELDRIAKIARLKSSFIGADRPGAFRKIRWSTRSF
jgi:hypothetical protein